MTYQQWNLGTALYDENKRQMSIWSYEFGNIINTEDHRLICESSTKMWIYVYVNILDLNESFIY